MASAVVGALRVMLEVNAAKFHSEFDKADSKVKSFDGQVSATSRSLGRMVDSFNGSRIVNEAAKMATAIEKVGGLSQLTNRELERVAATVNEATHKLNLMGAAVPANIQKLSTEINSLGVATQNTGGKLGSFSGILGKLGPLLPITSVVGLTTSIISLGTRALESAGKIQDLSQKTGISTEEIQRMQAVANQTGTSIDTFTQSAFRLGVNISEGTKKAKEAVSELGLEWDILKQKSPEQQFREVIRALEDVETTQERNALGVALFGKQFAEIAAAVAGGYSDIADSARVSSDAQIKALDRAADRWEKFKSDIIASTQSILGTLVLTVESINAAFSELKPLQIAQIIGSGAAAGMGPVQMLTAIATGMDQVGKKGKDIELPVKQAAKAIDEGGAASTRATTSVTRLTAAKQAAIPVYQLSARTMGLNQQEAQKWAFTNSAVLAPSIQDTAQEIREAVEAMSLLPASTDIARRGLEQFKQAVVDTGTETEKTVSKMETVFSGIGESILRAIQGGGDILKAAGSQLGLNLANEFVKKFGDTVKGLFGNVLGGIFNSLIPGLGALLGPLLGKIGSFFKNLFGIDPEVKAARSALEAFQQQLRAGLSDQQKQEAGNRDWAKDLIRVRDAYLAIGKTAEEAEKDVAAMWDTDNPEKSQAAIEKIQQALEEAERKLREGQEAAEDLADAVEDIPTDVKVRVRTEFDDSDIPPWLDPDYQGPDFSRPFGGGDQSPLTTPLTVPNLGQTSAFAAGTASALAADPGVTTTAPASATPTPGGASVHVMPFMVGETWEQVKTGFQRHLESTGLTSGRAREIIDSIASDAARRVAVRG